MRRAPHIPHRSSVTPLRLTSPRMTGRRIILWSIATAHGSKAMVIGWDLPQAPSNLLVALMVLLVASICIMSVFGLEYWIYVPNPPLLKPISWAATPKRFIVNLLLLALK